MSCMLCRCAGCRTQCCWLCGQKLPANNPYSHFTGKGCMAVGGGKPLQGGGVPAGAWARLPGEPPAAQLPGPAAQLAALPPQRAAPRAGVKPYLQGLRRQFFGRPAVPGVPAKPRAKQPPPAKDLDALLQKHQVALQGRPGAKRKVGGQIANH